MEWLITVRNILLALLPSLFWLWWYLRQDRAHPEPKRFIWRVFLLGMLVTLPALFIEYTIDLYIGFSAPGFSGASIIGALLVVAPVEELAKFVVVYMSVFNHKVFDERLDGVMYMVVASLGFATVENILIVLGEGASVLPLRFVTATLLHALAAGIVGYFMGMAKFAKRGKGWLIVLGLIIGIALHGLYDVVALSESNSKVSVLLLMMAIVFLVLDQFVRTLQKKDVAEPTK
ncbi:MAG: PrsW family intramembrane metalloprotease [bacterium]|nr:PrsW family intramembrane metalloprotease [bacterium]